jgi:hypothetical protein
VDVAALIDEITDLVVRRLAATGSASSSAKHVLFVMGDGERGCEFLPAQVRAVHFAGVGVHAVPSASWPRERLERVLPPEALARIHEAPPTWNDMLTNCHGVLIPNLSLNELGCLSMLVGLTPSTAAAAAALIEGRPVLAGGDDINFLTVNAARLPRAVAETVRGNAARVVSMGVRLLEGQRLVEEASTLWQPPVTAPSSARRNVLTREDVESLLRGGTAVIECSAGTIVTPLAQEVASAAGVQIVFR